MKSVVLLVATLLASSLAFSVTNITAGSRNDVLAPVVSGDPYQFNYYTFFVPENAQSVGVTVAETGTCTIRLYWGDIDGLPCTETYSGNEYVCNSGSYFDTDYTPLDRSNAVDSTESAMIWAVNTWYYVGIGRDYSSDSSSTCTYQFNLTIDTSCPVGTVATYTTGGSIECIPGVKTIAPNTPTTVHVAALIGSTGPVVLKQAVAINTAYINITVSSTSTSLVVYGRSAGGIDVDNGNSGQNCYTSTYTVVGANNIYTVQCPYPYQNTDFYVYIENGAAAPSNVSAVVTVTPVVCNNSYAGLNCNYKAYNLSDPTIYSATYTLVSGSPTQQYVYFYLDAPVGGLPADFNVSVSGSSSYTYYYRNRFVDDSYYGDYQSNPAYYVIKSEDLYPGGRYYIVVSAYSTGSTFTISTSSTSATTGSVSGSNTGVSTSSNTGVSTGSNTGVSTSSNTGVSTSSNTGVSTGSNTGASTGSASSVVASFLAVVLAIASLL